MGRVGQSTSHKKPSVGLWVAVELVVGCRAAVAEAPRPSAEPPPQAAAPAQAPASTLEGAWLGTLRPAGGQPLRVVVKLRRRGSGWGATLDSPDQRAEDIPIDTVVFEHGALTLRSAAIQGSFTGRLEGESLVGTFVQRGAELPLTLTRTSTPPTAGRRPQEPVPPFPYDEVTLAVDNPAGKDRLACTLTKPHGAGPFAAVVLITGSGPQNRDEALAGHKPFLVLADALARHGIAALRCDDRGTGQSTGDHAAATTFDFVGDVLAEVAVLRRRADISPRRLGLVGHSEGAIIAPIAAVRSNDVKFVVLLATPAVPGRETLELQSAALGKAKRATDAQLAEAAAIQREVYAVLETEKDGAAAAKKLRERYAALPASERQAIGPAVADAQIKQVTAPWFRTFLTLDPRVFLRQLAVPVLALQGERDLQVLPGANLPELRKALRDKPDVTIRELPGLNHLFQACQTGLPEEYARIDETLSPVVLSLVADWIGQRGGDDPKRQR
jgi:pimeloyl-ACP methyl ester carboxylesterase